MIISAHLLLITQAEIAKLGYEEGKEERLLSERKRLALEVQNHQEAVEKLEARLASFFMVLVYYLYVWENL